MKKAFVVIAMLLAFMSAAAKEFVHPGILHSASDLERMASHIKDGVEPATGSFRLLSEDPKSSSGYEIQGPFPIISRSDKYGFTKKPCEDDFNAAYYNSLMWAITGDESHARKSLEIIRAYAEVLRKIAPRDDPLCAGLQGFIIVNAAEIIRWTYPESQFTGGWNSHDTELVSTMFREAFLPVFTKFYNTPAYTNGNWGLAVIKSMMGMAVFLDDHELFDESVRRYLDPEFDNGSLPNYIAESGQTQESGRDQAHSQLGLGCMAEACEVAWNQGTDLYSALGNRLLKGYEYVAKYNLGYDDVPFFTWKDKTGKYCNWTKISTQARGNLRSVFEIVYGHYAGRMGLDMPYTREVLSKIRPEGKGFTCDHPGFGSLLFLQKPDTGIYHDGWIDFNKNGRKDVYEDRRANTEARVQDLLSQMTLDEKTCQMVTLYGTGRVLKDNLPTEEWSSRVWKDGVGNIDEQHNGVGKAGSEYAVPYSKHVDAIHQIQRWFIENTRLGIPVDFTNEGIRGLCHEKATYFPAQSGQGATWDKDLIARIGEVEAEEANALGYTNIYSPILDIAQDPRWGRCVESYGEDPYLVSQLGKQMTTALQDHNIVSTTKHFAVYSIPVGGRDGKTRTDPKVAPREMRTLYLEPFRVAFTEAGALGTMSSYNDYDGVPISGSGYFLTDILRKEWGFKGYVVSDSDAVEFLSEKHMVTENYEDAVAQCVNAGLNIRTTFREPETFVMPLRDAIRDGKIPMEVIDERVAEILRVKFWLGLFDNPYRGDGALAEKTVHSPEHRAVALEAARKSMVLLKNDGILPLSKKIRKVAVIGPNADEYTQLVCRYGPARPEFKTVLQGIREIIPDAKVSYAKGCDIVDPHFPDSEILPFEMSVEEKRMMDEAVRTARKAEVVVMVLGGNELTVREDRSRTSLDLPGRQEELLMAICALGKPTVLVMLDGRAATINWAQANVPAILHGWFPGEYCGQAVAETLFGDNNPGGRLAVTFPKSVGQIPFAFPFKPGSDEANGTSVWGALYPFGHGLSYTTFWYSDLRITPELQSPSGDVEISCTVTNTGTTSGDEVVQLYINDCVSSVTTYTKVLRGFERINLEPGESKKVTFTLKPQDLGLWDKDMKFTVEPGMFEVMVGASSQDIRLNGKFEIR